MSKYTTEVRYICETINGYDKSVDVNDVDKCVKNAYPKIFDNFPIFNEQHRETLCCKILKHYYTREIGEETFGLWKLRLNTKLEEIMPYYNELYKTIGLIDNPFVDKNITRTVSTKNVGNSNTTQSSSVNSLNKYSNTPQGAIEGLLNNEYLTDARMVEDKGNGNSNTNVTENQTVTENIKGKDGTKTYSEMLIQYREAFINVDLMIIKELSSCFMNIW